MLSQAKPPRAAIETAARGDCLLYSVLRGYFIQPIPCTLWRSRAVGELSATAL